MKRLLLILILIPSVAFGTFTEFYCQSGGLNLNAGSTTSNTALYTSTNGNWNAGTLVFTPTDGTNPVSAGVAVGMIASVYIDGASVSVAFGRITVVTNASNGAITVGAVQTGTFPSTSATTRTIKVGGAWLGPNAASGFPFTLTGYGNTRDATGHEVRTNLKNDQTYSMTSSFTFGAGSSGSVIQGYTSSVGDGGRFTMDGGTSTGSLITNVVGSGTSFIDAIFKTSITSGTTDLVTAQILSSWVRCVFTGSRGTGLVASTVGITLTECEAYNNNLANSSNKAGFILGAGGVYAKRCISHDNTGSNTSGFTIGSGPTILENCIASTNGFCGVKITGASFNGDIQINNCDFYNNGSDAINIAASQANPIWIENDNFIKNTGAGVNNVSVLCPGFVYNCGYGAGTQANGSADTINNMTQSGTITYASNVTPWVDPANGDFRINLAAANFAGRAAFLETAASYTGAVGYPDIGAAQSKTGVSGTFSKEVSSGYGY